MRLHSRTWLVISLLCLLGALFFWRLGKERDAARTPAHPAASGSSAQGGGGPARPPAGPLRLLSTAGPRIQYAATNRFSEPTNSRYVHRLHNSPRRLDDLVHSDDGILLANALIDATRPLELAIPESLRLDGETTSYVVQSRGVITDRFRRLLMDAGATIVSYVPNNALLVRMDPAAAGRIAGSPLVQSALPWEPYFKLEPRLLDLVLSSDAPSEDPLDLSLVVYPGEREAALKALGAMGLPVVGESKSPFGPTVAVRALPGQVSALAKVEVAQYLESRYPVGLLNDITRVTLKVSTNTSDTVSYLGLTGTNVLVNVNDTGVDSGHPDLSPRVFSPPGVDITDTDGHGTHVAGIIASSGEHGPNPRSTNAPPPGSTTNSNYRGKAPGASIFGLPLFLGVGPADGDRYLQETAAATNAPISNNSWAYAGAYGYTLNSASFDAAVRDALPSAPGEQSILYVFAAGNEGQGNHSGEGGNADSISSPGNAKNVITVGALESFRRITNAVIIPSADTNFPPVTNAIFAADTDSNDQVAYYSSRGNVGRAVEGEAGRFKPDVVAPGTFIVSTRASGWVDPDVATETFRLGRENQVIDANSTNTYGLTVPDQTIKIFIRTVPNFRSPDPMPRLRIQARKGVQPPPPADAQGDNLVRIDPASGPNWTFSIINTNSQAVPHDISVIIVATNGNVSSSYYTELRRLNDPLKDYYRFETGTSMAAPAVSGMLALLYEFLRDRLAITNPSPALMKALLINGARPVNNRYDLEVKSRINYQGWGRPDLHAMIPAQLDATRSVNDPSAPIWFQDQSPAAALTTGQSFTREVEVTDVEAMLNPLKITLVWTDPPGNPAVGTKLVNDLDLIVTNLDTGDVYYGNDIRTASEVVQPTDTNTVANIDAVNNVENVFIGPVLAERYSVTVRARRVNVNAVTAHPGGIAQDFALVIASADNTLTNAFLVTDPGASAIPEETRLFKELTNGIPLLHERVGANSPRLDAPGDARQWNFYKFVNVGNTNPYVAIITFQPPNLSRLRLSEADIDLYVSTDSAITNLDAGALAAADSSRTRGGTEYITYSNSPPDSVYYVGVKSEDQQASEFALVALATNEPFDQQGPNGTRLVRLLPMPLVIPDGSSQKSDPADALGLGLMFGVSRTASMIQNVIMTNVYEFENEGDVASFLHHSGTPGIDVTVSPHTIFNRQQGVRTIVYDDGGYNFIPKSIPTEGPGRMTAFIGKQMNGVWQLRAFDNAPFHTGRLNQATLLIKPMDTNCFTSVGCLITVAPHSWSPPLPFEITPDIIEADFCVSGNNNPLDMYIGMPQFPTPDDYYAYEKIDQVPSECLTLSYYTSPVIKIGQGITRIYNPNSTTETFRYRVAFTRGLASTRLNTYVFTNGPIPIVDDARIRSTINIPTNRTVLDLRVGVRADHPSVSDLVVALISPQGTRWLLSENRGVLTPDGFGFNLYPPPFANSAESLLTNYSWVTWTDNTNTAEAFMKFAKPPFRNLSLVSQPPVFTADFDGLAPAVYVQGQSVGLFGVETNGVAVLNLGSLASSGSNVLALSDGRVSATIPTREGREYQLKFAHRRASSSPIQQVTVPVGRVTGYLPADHLRGTIFPATSIAKVRLCPGQIVELSAPTNQLVVNAGGQLSDPMGPNPVDLFRGFPRYALIGQWANSATELSTLTAAGLPFFVGTNAVVAAPSNPGDCYLWLTINDDDFSDNPPGAFDVTIRWQQCQTDAFQYVLDGITNTIFTSDAWQTNAVKFLASATDEVLAFQPLWNSTTLLDSIEVVEPISTIYYSAEEPLVATTALQYSSGSGDFTTLPSIRGESAQGDWKLEVWDDRAQPGSPGGQLLAWYLQILFAPTQQGLPLTNCLPYDGAIRGSGIRYFEVRVPNEALSVRNTLTGSAVALLYNRDSLPDGVTDPFTPPANSFTVDITQPAGVELKPGGRYFLGVRNLDPASDSNTFSIRIDMELPMQTLVHGSPITFLGDDYAALTNTFPALTNTFPAVTNLTAITNILWPGTNMQWYKYVVDPSDTLDAMVFRLRSTNTALHLVAAAGRAEVDYLPSPTRYDYHSIQFDTTNEVIIVRTNDLPTPLTPIPWILGVYNAGTNKGFYEISATRWTNTPPSNPIAPPLPFYDIVTNWSVLTNEIGFAIRPGESLNYFYQSVSDPTNSAMLFEIYGLNGDADLLVRREFLPGMALYDFSDLQYGTNSEHVSIRTNLFLPTLGGSTNWFLNLANHDSLTVTGLVRVATASGTNVLASGLPLRLDLSGIVTAAGTGFYIEWRSLPGERYDVQSSTAPGGPFTSVTIITATTSTTRFVETTPPLVPHFYRVVQLGP